MRDGRAGRALRALALTVLLAAPVAAQGPAYERRELVIPMRDGARLTAVALVPMGEHPPLPILLVRTPFGAAREFRAAAPPAWARELAADGYIFVAQDIRGRSGAQGTFVTSRPMRDPADPRATDESTDAYDTVAWLVANLPHNNGKVGVLGVSYRGWLAALAGVRPHPAVAAISPQGPMADTWLGDDFFHRGAFRQTQGLLYAGYVEGEGVSLPESADQYELYLRYPTLAALAEAAGVADRASWVGFREHPAYDDYWKARALQRVLTQPAVPTLWVGGWWDEEDILGPQLGYRTLERADRRQWNHVVLGPWSHNAWIRPGGDSLGPLALGQATADSFRTGVQRAWFAHWLHGRGDGRFPEALVFETGGNAWRTPATWPPTGAAPRRLYLRAGGRLTLDEPPARDESPFDAWTSDPADPVPHAPRPITDEAASTWLVQDQRFLEGRRDVRTWQSAPLAEDLVIAGDVVATLFGSTTGTDADWVVKLIDVFPETDEVPPALRGYRLMVNADVMRGRYWKDFGRAAPIPANTVTPFTVDLHQQYYRFRKGHRLMVQVQGSWFPLYDRNPQTFVPNIFLASAADYRAREHRVWHTARHPSHVVLPVLR